MTLDIKTLEQWLWDAACSIRGDIDAPKYKDYILPLIFLKRISDVYQDEIKKIAEEFGSEEVAEEIANEDHNVVSFYIPKEARWEQIRTVAVGIGEYLTKVVRRIAKENPKLNGVIDIVDFNATAAGQRIISDEKLQTLVDILTRYRIGLKDAEPDIIGQAYEYMLRKFSEGSGSSAGEFFTPPEVSELMARLIDPEPNDTIYDPTCGSAGLLIKSHSRFKEKYPDSHEKEQIRYYGQEISHLSYAMAKMNAFIHKLDIDIKLGDTMLRPAFTTKSGSLLQFDKVIANPMWNQKFDQEIYENDSYNRFTFGYPPNNTADWGWIQHMCMSLKPNGKLAIVIDTGCVSRGSGTEGNNKERDIRKIFVEKDLIEMVILLPDNMFYNTAAAGVIIILNKIKKKKKQILVVNASDMYKKGRPKNHLTSKGIKTIFELYQKWEEKDKISRIIKIEDLVGNDYNLSPSRYVSNSENKKILSLEDAISNLLNAESERKKVDEKFILIMKKMGLV